MELTAQELDLAREGLACLVGLPLTDMWRAAGQWFEFGEQRPTKNRKGQDITAADRRLVVYCAWWFEGPGRFVLSYTHIEPTRCDMHAWPFYRRLRLRPPVVDAVETRSDGTLLLAFTEGSRLTVTPRRGDQEIEDGWRFMPPEDDPRGHLVFEDRRLSWSR